MKTYKIYQDGRYVGEFLAKYDAKWFCDKKNEYYGYELYTFKLESN